MNSVNRLENAALEVLKGNSSWEEARILFDNGKYDGAITRAYYAAFHYASALLLTKGLEARSHQALRRLFHLHFIRTNTFPERMGTVLSHAQKAREEADYYPEVTFSKETAAERLREVETFLTTARTHLSSCGVSI